MPKNSNGKPYRHNCDMTERSTPPQSKAPVQRDSIRFSRLARPRPADRLRSSQDKT